MKPIEQVACAAYAAFCAELGLTPDNWGNLPPARKAAWIAAVSAVREEIAAIH